MPPISPLEATSASEPSNYLNICIQYFELAVSVLQETKIGSSMPVAPGSRRNTLSESVTVAQICAAGNWV
jgi:hypothetical protein